MHEPEKCGSLSQKWRIVGTPLEGGGAAQNDVW